MRVGKFFGLVLGVLLIGMLNVGCAAPQIPFTIVNNTKAVLDVECVGREIVPNLAEGKSFTFNVGTFYDAGGVTLVAKGHTDAGQHIGVATHDIVFVNQYHGWDGHYGRSYNYYREARSSGTWVVNQIDLSHDVQNSNRARR